MPDHAPDSVTPEPPPPTDPVRRAAYLDSARAERRALGVCAAMAILVIIWITRPVGVGILLGTLIAFSLQPFYERLVERHGRPGLIALAFVLGSAVGVTLVLGGLSSLFIARGAVLAQGLISSLAPGGTLREVAGKVSSRLGPLQFKPDEVTAKLHDAATDLASRAASIASEVATTTANVLLALFFAMMTLSFMLRRWNALAQEAEGIFPLRPRYTRAILAEFQRVGRATLLGTVFTGLAQGALAALGYWATGVPEAAFFGAATALASLIPGVGTLLVWVPAGLFLIGRGQPAMGVAELCWGGLVVVGACDYFIRPRLVGGHGSTPALLTFAALFGGVEVFGLAGLVVGPLLMSVSFAILRIFAKDAEERRALGERHV